MDEIVHCDFGHEEGQVKKPHLILLGGIQINMPQPMHDFFLPLMFEVRTNGEPTVDLMETVFSDIVLPQKKEEV